MYGAVISTEIRSIPLEIVGDNYFNYNDQRKVTALQYGDHYGKTPTMELTTKHFTFSQMFTKSSHFSPSQIYTQSSMFSKSNTFTISSKFTNSQSFTSSSKFTSSSTFTASNLFTKSSRFSDSTFFIASNMFTMSDKFSCGGGAIYIKNWLDLEHNLTMKDISINKCRALYGGGISVYSESEENEVKISKSVFSHNLALLTSKTEEYKNLFGGNHLFVSVKNLFVKDSVFEKGIGNSAGVKIYNVFDQKSNRVVKLDEGENFIMFSGCNFELDEKSKSSINYIDFKNKNKIELVDCSFAGKVSKERHYVDGNVGSKDNNNKIKIISCKFEYENELAVKIDTLLKR